MSEPLPIVPFTRPARATVRLPGSKSITNRALLLAALGSGTTTLRGALFSDDTVIMAEGLRRLGFTVHEDPARATITVEGGDGAVPRASADLFVGLAGTAARFLTALCCAASRGRFSLDGVEQMRRRPMKSLLDALQALGASVTSADGFLPLAIEAHGLRGGVVSLDATESSQLLSALLMVAPLASGPVRIRLTDPGYRREYVTMTLRMMEQFGQPPARVSEDGLQVEPPQGGRYASAGGDYVIEPDASAASYFLALPIVTGGRVNLPGLARPSLQGDAAFAERIARVGGIVSTSSAGTECAFDLAASGPPKAIHDDFHAISDTFLTLAAIAPLLAGETRISGIAHTRKQETDRVSAMVAELRRVGQDVEESQDAITIRPRPLRPDVQIDTYGDHRFAMSFGILGCHDLRGDGRPWLAIRNPGVCAKTFPKFFETLEQVRLDSLQT